VKYAFVIEPGQHAELSASGADRWATCTASPALIKGLPNHGSKYAAEGTAAHYIAAECQKVGGWHQDRLVFGLPATWVGETAKVEGYEIPLTEELCDAVEEFLDYIADNERPGDVAVVEQSFTAAMRKLHPKFGGSTDRVMWRESERLLRVYDYKHGAGVPVDVDDNKQLKYYALGALLSNPAWNALTVELVIAQPRCDHEQGRIRSYKFPAIDLIDYAADLIDAAKETEDFVAAKLVPSKKACRFCPANAARKCPAIEKETHALVVADFDIVTNPERYSKEQIAEFLTKLPLLEGRIAAIREFAYQEELRGNHIPGFKIVEKRATRKWKDAEEVSGLLGHKGECFTAPELKSPAQVEKVLGKKKFAAALAQHVDKQSSGYTLVSESDPRPPAQVAQLEDFGVIGGNAEAE
jgi:hypothetical protein